jgi:hypothetical protein
MMSVVMLNDITMNIVMHSIRIQGFVYSECHHVQFANTECRYAKCHYGEFWSFGVSLG